MNPTNITITCIDEPLKTFNFIERYYYILIGISLLFVYAINYFIKFIPTGYSAYVLLASFTSFTVLKDIHGEAKIKPFLFFAIPLLIAVGIVLFNGNVIWHNILKLEMKNNILINLNDTFSRIPFNDASFARIFQPTWLTTYMKMIYNTGFVLSVLVPLYRATLSINLKKMFQYILSTHIFQVFIITPFYFVFRLQEVWFVHGHPDMLVRNLSGINAFEATLNCLPSMHTSIAFAVFLLILKEKDNFFKFVWGFYCLSVIYSTMYLEIHWIIDVFAGLLLGYYSVKLANYTISKVTNFFSDGFIKTSTKDSQAAISSQSRI